MEHSIWPLVGVVLVPAIYSAGIVAWRIRTGTIEETLQYLITFLAFPPKVAKLEAHHLSAYKKHVSRVIYFIWSDARDDKK